MYKITLRVEGMLCGMCETHVNEAIRKVVTAKKVKSSHVKNEAVIIAEEEINVVAVKSAVSALGYSVTDAKVEPYEKKGIFGFFKK